MFSEYYTHCVVHLFRCSTSAISWSWYTQQTFWKCWIWKHRCFCKRYKLLSLYI